mmetsp:Transcript_5928/g.23407  ORF Transcript_5928/g.23407 Transcript_5928/m.23407 type:complete len:120 (+) Transcript_5928:17-376(+)
MVCVCIQYKPRKRQLSFALDGHRTEFQGLGLFATHALEAVGLVLVVRAFEKDDVGVALVGQDVGGDLVQEPAIVRDADCGAVPALDGVLEASKGGDVQVVGGLVEEEAVAAARERASEL